MPKRSDRKTSFFCQHCGHESSRWMGFCSACGERTPLVEAPRVDNKDKSVNWISGFRAVPTQLSLVDTKIEDRVSVGLEEVDRVLGGGLVTGSLVLFAGEPGVGKSTLLLQSLGYISEQGRTVLYVSGEESDRQIKLRSERIGLSEDNIFLLSETDVDRILNNLEQIRPTVAVIDSVQTLFTEDAQSGPGSVTQVRECSLRLMRWGKATSTPLLLAGHVTKDGTVAGPRVLEHMVDVVLYLEGENLGDYRLLRSTKNRFGSTNEVAMLQMSGRGMEEVLDPSKVLLEERSPATVGSAVVPILEGSRPILVEIQALTSPSTMPAPRRTANGVDYNRMMMVSAVLSRRAGLNLSNQDVITNVAGGIRITEPAADLGLALAIASSFKNLPLKPELAAIGEVGLSGEIRSAPQMERRLSEASRLGFRHCVIPASFQHKIPQVDGMEYIFVSVLSEAIERALLKRAKNFVSE